MAYVLTTIATHALRRRAVPSYGPLGRDGNVGAACFVGRDEVRHHELECGVVEAVDVDLGTRVDLGGRWGVQVAGLAVVVPWKNWLTPYNSTLSRCWGRFLTSNELDVAGRDIQDLLPAVEPERVAGRVPVLGPTITAFANFVSPP